MNDERTRSELSDDATRSQTVVLRVIAALLIVGACWVLATILVPFVLAVVLAVALAPLADRLERIGAPRAVSSLVCMLAVAAVLAGAVGLMTYQAGTILQDSDRYVHRFGTLIDRTLPHPGGDRSPEGPDASKSRLGAGREEAGAAGKGEQEVRRVLDGFGRWVVTGVGGLLGAVGGAVVFLAFLFYILHGRKEWVGAITAASRQLGLKPTRGQLEAVQGQVVRYVTVLAGVSACYVVVVSLALWMIGVPQPLLWGMLAGLFEVVPYFGPLVASVLPTVVSLSLGHWWQPVATASLFIVLHTLEGYVITPLLYGKAVKLDPVTILFGALFFGAIWGPVGLAVATPSMIILRGLLLITPDTPALDALADVQDEKEPAAAGGRTASTRNGA